MEKTKNNPHPLLEHLTPGQAQELIAKHTLQIHQQEFIILDVRTPEEYNKQHLPNSININFYAPNFEENITPLDRNKTYLVHCRSGGRSSKTVALMSQLHFRYLYNVQGFLFPEP